MDQQLWQNVLDFNLDEPVSAYSFSKRWKLLLGGSGVVSIYLFTNLSFKTILITSFR